MKKVLLMIGGCLMIAGIALFIFVAFVANYDFMELGSMNYVTNNHDIQESFESISINTVTADVEIKPSADGQCHVVCHEKEKLIHKVSVKNGTLTISLVDERNWLDHIKGSIFNFGTTLVTVYLPEGAYDELKVDNTTGHVKLAGDWQLDELDLQTTTGDICVDGVTCDGAVSLHVTTGMISLENLICENLTASGSTGDAVLKNVIVSDTLRVKRTTGDIKLNRCDAGEVYINATTGDVTGSFLTPKVIYAKSTTGDVDVPMSTTGGLCEIDVTTGDIRIKIG